MLWSDVVGQEPPLRFLRRALAAGRLPHAVLLWGAGGVGKRTAARALAAASLCAAEAPAGRAAPDEACGRCDACREFRAGVHPDYLLPDIEDEARTIKIDLVRGLMRDMNLRPVRGRRRVAVVPRADRLGEDSQNALLKSLEEPADSALWILTAEDPAKILGTVRSRTVQVRFSRLSAAAVADLLGRAGVADAARASELAAGAAGSYARAVEMASEEWSEERSFVEREVLPRIGGGARVGPALARALAGRSSSKTRRASKEADEPEEAGTPEGAPSGRQSEIEESRRPVLRMLQALAERLRRRMRQAALAGPDDADFWSGKVEVVLDSDAAIRQNVRPDLVLAAAAARLAADDR